MNQLQHESPFVECGYLQIIQLLENPKLDHGKMGDLYGSSIFRHLHRYLSIYRWIFQEINHPAIKGYPHDYGNLRMDEWNL